MLARAARGIMVIAMTGCLAVTGCNSAMMHELKPHRLWRLNRGPSHNKSALFSVADDLRPSAENISGDTVQASR